jgi:arylsulfatase A-like enzyme
MSVPVAEGVRSAPAAGARSESQLARALDAARCGMLGALALLLGELVLVLWLRREQITSVWEAQVGGLLLLPSCFVAAAVFGGIGAGLFELLKRAHASAPDRIALSLLIATGAGVSAYGVSGGRQLSAPGVRSAFCLLVAAVAFGMTLLVAKFLSRLVARTPLRCAALGASAVLLLELANRFVLVRLYPGFHASLAACTLLLAALVALMLRAALRPRPSELRRARLKTLGTLGIVALGVLAAAPASKRLSRFDNVRWLLLESAPLSGQLVSINALLAPPEPLSDEVEAAELAAGAQPTRALDFRDRDVLLVTIDALRADHVGAYGYARARTPHLDALATRGTLFERAYCATPHTSYSITSLHTGKYMRPLLLQGAGEDSDTWASLLRLYGYRTAAFYPPAVFFIDQQRFAAFEQNQLGFEYRWVEFAEGEKRVAQVRDYLAGAPRDKPLFVWVHLFGPHEPYEAQPGFDFGDRDVDRYDSEIAAADATLGRLLEAMQERRGTLVTIVSADHGEEFGDHGGRYHGTSVYEEQVRVPLIIAGPGVKAQRSPELVETIDLLPTLLSALDIPRPPRLRGTDLGPLLAGTRAPEAGTAYAETEEHVMYGEGPLRLICARKLGACKLFDISSDPMQRRDLSSERPSDLARLRARQRELSASHGRYEQSGLRAEGKGFPPAILRGAAGDGDAAEEIAALLDDADPAIRVKAAELLFELERKETAPALRLALSRADDEAVRRYAALALTRLGEGAPLTAELLTGSDEKFRRLAALAIAESGDRRGEEVLVAWWRDASGRDFERSRELLDVFGALRVEDALVPLLQSLSDVRLRPHIAHTLGKIGEAAAIGPLLAALVEERMQSTRVALAAALAELDAGPALAPPLARFLGVPDPLPNGLALAERAGILEHVGGPSDRELARLRRDANLGAKVTLTIPGGGNGTGARLLVRVANSGAAAGTLLFSRSADTAPAKAPGVNSTLPKLPVIDEESALRVSVPPSPSPVELAVSLPERFGARAGLRATFVLYAERGIELNSLAVVPNADELPPPPPKPWVSGIEPAP